MISFFFSSLELLLLEAKRLVQEQQKLAAAFVQNQQRASGLRDNSILPDLCASHRQQLNVMRENHQQIISICNRTAKAKNELSDNLHKRMKWVVFIQNKITDNSNSIGEYKAKFVKFNVCLSKVFSSHKKIHPNDNVKI